MSARVDEHRTMPSFFIKHSAISYRLTHRTEYSLSLSFCFSLLSNSIGAEFCVQIKDVAITIPEGWFGGGSDAAVPDDDGETGAPVVLHSQGLFHIDISVAAHCCSFCRRCQSPPCRALLRHHSRRPGSLHLTPLHALHLYSYYFVITITSSCV